MVDVPARVYVEDFVEDEVENIAFVSGGNSVGLGSRNR